MAPSRLSLSDTQDEHDGPGYSSEAATMLDGAYAALAKDELAHAEYLVLSLLGAPMGVWQRLRVLYILSLTNAARGTTVSRLRALAYVDEGLELAGSIDDLDSLALFGNRGASASHGLQWFARAYSYYTGALEALRAQGAGNGDPAPYAHLKFDLLVGAATDAFLCADVVNMRLLIDDAHRTTSLGIQAELRRARLEWLESMVATWNNEHWPALQLAVNAAETYAVYGAPIPSARVSVLLANCYLDVALPPFTHLPSHVPPATERFRFVDLAARPLEEALASTKRSGDRAAEGLALLASARFVRAAHGEGDPMTVIAQCEEIARDLLDAPLMAQVFTARGMEFIARGELGSARSNFTAAIDTLKESDAKAYAIQPLRALRIDEEFR